MFYLEDLIYIWCRIVSKSHINRAVVFSLVTLMLMMFLFSMLTVSVGASTVADEKSLPVSIYIVSLADVGNYRASNLSMVVEGAIQATKVDTVSVFLDWGNVGKVNVSITVHIISDWEAYRMLIEWGNNVIVVNTHDEYLPVPSGYTKEGWTDKISDFMLNRWGTWTHLGGYPLYRVWYQNGTKEEWGERGFKTLMNHIGKGNATCNSPTGENTKADIILNGAMVLGSWYWSTINRTYSLVTLARVNVGRPLKYQDFEEEHWILPLYEWTDKSTGKLYWPIAAIKFSEENRKFGIYVHLGAWRFYDASDNEFSEHNDLALGFVSTAVAIWSEAGWPILEIYEASDAIQRAMRAGHTGSLDQAENLLQRAIDTYNQGKYKESVIYSEQAAEIAQNAREATPPYLNYGLVAVVVVMGGAGAYYMFNSE